MKISILFSNVMAINSYQPEKNIKEKLASHVPLSKNAATSKSSASILSIERVKCVLAPSSKIVVIPSPIKINSNRLKLSFMQQTRAQ